MKAWLMDGNGGLEKLRIGEAAEPVAKPGEVVLEIGICVSLNPADRYLSEGMYPGKLPLPHILEGDGVGTVVAVANGEAKYKVGQKLMILRGEIGVNRAGTFAQRVAVPTEYLVDLLKGWSDEESAGATLVYLTAYQGADDVGEICRRRWCW